MTPYINPAFRNRDDPVALLTGAVEDSKPVYHGPGMSPEFRARGQAIIEAQAREVTPAPTRIQRSGRHAAYCVSLAFPISFAVWSIVIGDMRMAVWNSSSPLFTSRV